MGFIIGFFSGLLIGAVIVWIVSIFVDDDEFNESEAAIQPAVGEGMAGVTRLNKRAFDNQFVLYGGSIYRAGLVNIFPDHDEYYLTKHTINGVVGLSSVEDRFLQWTPFEYQEHQEVFYHNRMVKIIDRIQGDQKIIYRVEDINGDHMHNTVDADQLTTDVPEYQTIYYPDGSFKFYNTKDGKFNC